ncbi:MAG: Uma2 family endonuclease [Cyanobacteriota bacterium]
MVKSRSQLTLEEFLALPDDDVACELIDGQAVPKMSPKGFHAAVQSALLILFSQWCEGRGRIYTEWAVILKRQGKNWVPTPDLTYISYERLPADWMKDEACPTPCELAIEIISPGQTFGELTAKATDYLAAGVLRVWIVDTQARSITIFYPDAPPQTCRGTMSLTDSIFPELHLTSEQVFQKAGLSTK